MPGQRAVGTRYEAAKSASHDRLVLLGREMAELAAWVAPERVATVDVRNDFSLWRNIMRE